MNLSNYAHGREAADLMNLSTADNVWRAIARHGATYQEQTGNEIEVVAIGTKKLVLRSQLMDFRLWYDVAVRIRAKEPAGWRPSRVFRVNPRRVSEWELKKRRLGVLIRRIQIAQEAGD
jgi:hypothetical protein